MDKLLLVCYDADCLLKGLSNKMAKCCISWIEEKWYVT